MSKFSMRWLAVAALSAGLFQACGKSKDDCDDVNQNGMCDVDEPGHGQCPAIDRNADGECPAGTECGPRQIVVDDACEDCPAGEHAENNVCVADVDSCPTGEILDGNGGCCPDADGDDACDTPGPTCGAGETDDGQGGCCDDANGNDICDDDEVICDAGQTPDGNGGCCDDANNNLTCDDEEAALNCDADEVIYAGACCEDADGDSLCDLDPADACIGLNNSQDADEDGYCSDTDCNDNDKHTYPGASEICGSLQVNDCNNPCHAQTSGCDVNDRQAAKSGQASIEDSNGDTSDVTAAFTTPGNIAEFDSSARIDLCGNTTFTTRVKASGSGTHVNIRAVFPNTQPRLSAEMNDDAVIQASDSAMVIVSDVGIEHTFGFTGANGHGIHCDGAEVIVQNGGIQNNAADFGAGIYAKDCGANIYGDVNISGNSAKEGAALYFTDGTLSESKDGIFNVSANTVADDASAAIVVANASKINWAIGSDRPIVNFRGNRSEDGNPRDILVQENSSSSIAIRDAKFLSPGADHVRAGSSSYNYTMGVSNDLACDDTSCTP